MDLQTYLLQYGLASYRVTLFISIPTTPEAEIPLPKQMPQNIGRIFGLSTYADTVTPANSTLITTSESQLLYFTFKDAATEFFINVRFDDLLYNFAGVPTPSGQKFLPVNLPGQFDLSNSFISNPTLIVTPAAPATKVIALTFHYISQKSYQLLLKGGYMLDEVRSRKVQTGEANAGK